MSGGHTHALHVHGHSLIHRLPPETKVAAHLAFVVAVVLTPRSQVWAFAVHALLLLGVVSLSEVPFGFFVRRLGVEIPFVLFAVFLPFLGGGPEVTVGGLELSREGLWGAWNILAKATLGVGASVMLVATTEVPELLRGLDRLKVPTVITAIAGFMVRYLDVIAGELRRMRTAMAARGYQPQWIGQIRGLAHAGGALFIRSYERGERVHQAMLARGYGGRMPDLGTVRARKTEWVLAGVVPLSAWVVAMIAVAA
ncbi:MAG TPA: cobalt ECF transporter T component CbiQ [Acidimicrobiia bacterium]